MTEYNIHFVNTENDLQAAFEVRQEVFVKEQKVPEDLELDDLDRNPNTLHILARDRAGRAVGTARLRPYSGKAKIERVAVVSSCRGTGLGRALMLFLEQKARQSGYRQILLNAQLQAQGFYERLGYCAEGEHFLDAGIEHTAMYKQLD